MLYRDVSSGQRAACPEAGRSEDTPRGQSTRPYLRWQSSIAALQHTCCTGEARLIVRMMTYAQLFERSAWCHFRGSLNWAAQLGGSH